VDGVSTINSSNQASHATQQSIGTQVPSLHSLVRVLSLEEESWWPFFPSQMHFVMSSQTWIEPPMLKVLLMWPQPQDFTRL